MPFETTIRTFAAALDDPSAATPAMTRGRMGAPDGHRFAVYRNNVAVGLIGALEARYPVSRRIAGDDLFRAMARAFVRANRPRSPVMIAYGEDFPEFAGAYLTAAEAWPGLAVLADVARLENAWVEAYHAEDATAATVGELAALSPDCLFGAPDRVSPCSAAFCASPRPPPRSGRQRRVLTTRPRQPRGSVRTRSSPVPTATSACACCRRWLMLSL